MEGFHRKQSPGIKKSSMIIGRQPIIEAIEAGRAIDKILFQRNVTGDAIGKIRQLSRDHNIPIQQVPPEKLNAMTKANHQGTIAIAGLVQYMDLQQVIDHVVGSGEVPLFVMLDGVTDVRNIGAIARTALCCGAQAIIIPDKGVGALNEEAIKSSAGALERIHICRVNSLMKAVDSLHLNGIKVFASEMTANETVFELEYREPCCIIAGSEDKGVFSGLLKISDSIFKIPMAGGFESLNVSVAMGMILYEAMKQRLFSTAR
ncbi:23S rRNA (guanosine(2251)-2'-O)-methyltransferase RlmB [Pseudoflavitalea sp. G-6-1-2]|uniref:23S rRNA (guanosine(2251)-2'-O)-methyltransferase RlmB n=1 Tax=Pseudoflavitalea sp. G-6-1-2 TaxID=2728841 RepID=UPI00146B25DD|nr:23S rRNA (guanosine(2251)-2'-O)-methyltransferase RlmB [Pseudoflavitalea sp. G-6-1-2]NML23731.1 23S rRNA (guanosine(2251)-2'-O)-methyltransferase RlmB [Pseudoflavitalea sp. G-6-1-2]